MAVGMHFESSFVASVGERNRPHFTPGESLPEAIPAEQSLPVFGRWRAVQLVHESTFTQVFQARPSHVAEHRPPTYGLKTITTDPSTNDIGRELLSVEATMSRQVRSPHLACILAGHLEAESPYLVFPWLPGANAEVWLAGSGAPPLHVALCILRQIAQALEALHVAGWRHGDLKPENVIVSPRGHATLIDLGMAARLNRGARSLVQGSKRYMAPELFSLAHAPDHRADFYSFGLFAYELITGRHPFHGVTDNDMPTMHASEPAPKLRTLAPETPLELARLIHQLLSKSPDRRPDSAGEILRALFAAEISAFSLAWSSDSAPSTSMAPLPPSRTAFANDA